MTAITIIVNKPKKIRSMSYLLLDWYSTIAAMVNPIVEITIDPRYNHIPSGIKATSDKINMIVKLNTVAVKYMVINS